jgi:hypothetical protein
MAAVRGVAEESLGPGLFLGGDFFPDADNVGKGRRVKGRTLSALVEAASVFRASRCDAHKFANVFPAAEEGRRARNPALSVGPVFASEFGVMDATIRITGNNSRHQVASDAPTLSRHATRRRRKINHHEIKRNCSSADESR